MIEIKEQEHTVQKPQSQSRLFEDAVELMYADKKNFQMISRTLCCTALHAIRFTPNVYKCHQQNICLKTSAELPKIVITVFIFIENLFVAY